MDTSPVEAYIAALEASPRYGGQVVHHRVIEARPAAYGDPAVPLPAPLAALLAERGISRLYRHQAESLDLVRAGHHLMVATATASGKSMTYNLPVLEACLADPNCRALYLFPLKALAQDQLRTLEGLCAGLPEDRRPRAAVIDGDTSPYRRRRLRQDPPNILLSNPDMLHLSLLGHHDRWAAFWPHLRFLVVDEVHTCRGVFGSHMAWVLRRLLRICREYGSAPQCIMSSATVGNPAGLARQLLGAEAAVVTESGAPHGRQHFLFLDPLEGAPAAACDLLAAAVHRGLRTIVYTGSRKVAELVSLWAQRRLRRLAGRISPYRAGYLPGERRAIEDALARGDLLAVVSTSALELGIDIGALDCCLLVGYPGTVTTTWQRSGRVGRRQRPSLTVLIGQEDALDAYFMRHPEEFFDRPVEDAVLNPANPVVMASHLECAAAEMVLEEDDPILDEPGARRVLAGLEASGRLLRSGDGRRWHAGRRYPHRDVSLRGTGATFRIYQDPGRDTPDGKRRLLGEVDGYRCLRECHPGAVYLHRGETWLVSSLDIEGREVTVAAGRVKYYTRPLAEKHTEILAVEREAVVGCCRVSFGRLRVSDRVVGFQRRLVRGGTLVGSEPLDLPPHVFETEGIWIEIPDALQQEVVARRLHFMGGIHALEHAAIGILPLLVLCDRNDIGGISQPDHPQLDQAAVFIYDGHPGGIGICRQVFRKCRELLERTREVISGCACGNGCPSCVHSPKCGSGNRPIDKEAALLLADRLLRPGPRPAAASRPLPVPRVAALEGSPARLRMAEADKTPSPGAPPPGLHYCVFDVETQRSAQEVGGWHRAERMGVSVAVLYDSELDAFQVYEENDVPAMIARLEQCGLVVGFNNRRFDNRVLLPYGGGRLAGLPTIDLLEEVQRHLNYRLSLDRLAEHTLGVKKSGSGLDALRWYREGNIAAIAEYCTKDVAITRDLFLFGLAHGYFLFRNKAGHLVRCPVTYGERLGRGGLEKEDR